MQQNVNIEVILKNHSHSSKKPIIPLVEHFLKSKDCIKNGIIDDFDPNLHPILHSDVKSIIIEDIKQPFNEISNNIKQETNGIEIIDYSKLNATFHVYTLDQQGPVMQIEDDGDSQENIATHLMLPSAELYNLWENLYFDHDIKQNLLKYAQTMMEFSDRGVDPNTIICNRVILLHGPPGTGKTSLCKALAHKLSIRMQNRYKSGILIEINSHSLFSKWFSESGKLVTKLFTRIREVVENPDVLACVLIDEVESLAHARNQCLSGNEPSDAIRVVNAVLTQIDQIKRFSNVLILTTSNISESIDLAFIDRADIKQFLGLPSLTAIQKVYESCLEELVKAGIIINSEISIEEALIKSQLCKKSLGLSGRTLRKIPFITHALFVNISTDKSLVNFIELMEKAVDREVQERKHFEYLK